MLIGRAAGQLLLFCIFLLLFNLTGQAQQARWQSTASVNEARQEVGVAALDGKLYIIGGFNRPAAQFGVTFTAEVYDPTTDRWSFIATLPEPLHHTTAVGLNGQLYVIGGYNTLSFNPVNSVYRYDPTTNSWSKLANLPSARGALAAVAIGNKIYAVGGEGANTTGELNVYDPATDRWSTLSPMPTPREHICAGVINGKLYVAGGRRGSSFTLDTLEEYDPVTNQWRSRASMPTGRSGIAAAVLNNRLYVFGGEGNITSSTGTFAENESYDPITNSWQRELAMPLPRHGIGAATIGGRIYLPAGAPIQGFSVTSACDFYEPSALINQPPNIEVISDLNLRGGEQRCLDLRISDPENDVVTLTCAPENPRFVNCPQATSICLAPTAADEGQFNICIIARDANNNQTRACFNLNVFINHSPTLTPIADQVVFEQQPITLNVVAKDIDASRDAMNDGRLSLSLVGAPGFIKLTDQGRGQGSLSISPGIGDGGSGEQNYPITIIASDSGNPALTAAISFQVKVRTNQTTAPIVSSAQFRSRRLVIRGQQLSPTPMIEINGKLIDTTRLTRESATQLRLSGNKTALNLTSGNNSLVVIVAGVRSAAFIFNVR